MAGNKYSGRKCDWFIDECNRILSDEKLLQFVGDVASGKETEQRVVVVREGNSAHTEVVEVKCSTQDRLAAFKMLAEWGIGKPTQFVVSAPRTPEESKRNAEEVYAGLIRLEQDAIARYRETVARR